MPQPVKSFSRFSSLPRSSLRLANSASRSSHRYFVHSAHDVPFPESSIPAPPPSYPSHHHSHHYAHNSTALARQHDKVGSYSSSSTASYAVQVQSTTSSTSKTHAKPAQREPYMLFTNHLSSPSPISILPSFIGSSVSCPKRSFVFQHGAAGIPKGDHAAVSRPPLVDNEPCLSVQVGQDAYFVRSDALGIADGVGGWTAIHKGADPAAFASLLMHHCSSYLARYDNIDDDLFLSYDDVEPVEVLHHSYTKLLDSVKQQSKTAASTSPDPSNGKSSEPLVGSSTALLAVLRNDELRVANMGDCCCSVIRGDEYVFRSEEQQHSFNFPVQLSTKIKDTPRKDAQSYTVKVQKDDIVILSSDGLNDNLFAEEVVDEVTKFMRFSPSNSKSPQQADTPPPLSSSSTTTTATATTSSSSSSSEPFAKLSSLSFSQNLSPSTTVPSLSSSPSSASSSPEPRSPTGRSFTLRGFNPQAVSEALCSRAKAVSEDKMAVTSPFQVRATEEGIHYVGGKRDDISVIVALVGEQEDSPNRR